MTRRSFHDKCVLVTVLLMFQLSAATTKAQTTGFTYQGRLTDGGTVPTGNYDLQFTLWDSLAGGTQIGSTQTVSTVAVSAGIFTVTLDFGGSAFPGANRFLEIGARLSGGGAFTILSPRQPITPTPYAIRSLNASSADAVTVNGVPSGSGNYVQNSTSQQVGSNFNISGNGTAGGTLSANIVNAATQYNIGGVRMLSAAGTNNLFAGTGAGAVNTSGVQNAFFGANAGLNNTTSCCNSFFGNAAGRFTTGTNNSFFGDQAGNNNGSGSFNVFVGAKAGQLNSTGDGNVFIGGAAGSNSSQSSYSTIIGYNPKVLSVTNATAIGAFAEVDQSDSLVLGSIAGVNSATNSVNVGIGTTTPQARLDVNGTALFQTGNVGIGTNTPQNTLHVKGGTLIETTGSGGNIQFGTPNSETGMTIIKTGAGAARADLRFDASILKLVANSGTSIPAATSGIAITTSGAVGIGTAAPKHHLAVIGGPSWTTASWAGSMEFGNASAIGWQGNAAGWHFGIGQSTGGLYFFQTSSELGTQLSPPNYIMTLDDGGRVGIGTSTPNQLLSVNGTASKPGGGSWDVFSDARLKNIKGRFTSGLTAVMQLQPLRYEYKRDNVLNLKSEGEHVGFSAQAVQKIIPEAVTKDDKGYLLVNNDPIMWSMLNAIKEQQKEIENQQLTNQQQQVRIKQQQTELNRQRQEVDALKQLVCKSHRQANVCR